MLLCDPGTGGTGIKSAKNKREKDKEKEETETKTQSGRQLPLSTLYMICFSATPGPEGQTITSINTVYDMLLCDPGTGGTDDVDLIKLLLLRVLVHLHGV